jgi:arylsulfatase A-like enzyme
MAAYGNDAIDTPNLNRLAETSTVFQNAYVTQPVCTPSRSSLMTGLYPHTTGCTRNNVPLSLETPCLPEIGDFRHYATAYHGKWHLGDEIYPQHNFHEWISIDDQYCGHYRPWRSTEDKSTYYHWLGDQGVEPNFESNGWTCYTRDFCARLPEELSKPAYLAGESSRFIRENRDRPWMLTVNFFEPHMPYFGPRDNQYDPADVTLPEDFDAWPTEDQPVKTRALAQWYQRNGHSGLSVADEAGWRRMIANYWGLCSLVDTHFGRILRTLEETGQADNTIIVYTSDHGDMMGSHRLLAKCVQFRRAVRVPLLLRLPGQSGRRDVADPVSQVDLVPTLLEAMGRRVDESLQGQSWTAWLDGRRELEHQDVFVEWNGSDNGVRDPFPTLGVGDDMAEVADPERIAASITDPVRTVLTRDGWRYSRSTIGEDELYDLNEDPHERRNLVSDPAQADRVDDLRRRIENWQRRTGDTITWPN